MGPDDTHRANDADLLGRVASRDPRALGALFDRHAPVVLALARRVLRHPQDAEEVIGDVFWDLWCRPDRFDSTRGNLVGYLLTLTRSRAIDRVRARRRTDARRVPADEAAPSDSADRDAAPLAAVLDAERGRRIRRALDRLNPDQRRAIELAYYSGLSQSEVAAELGQPLGTIKSRIRHGLIQLRDELRSALVDGVEP